jgi:hypothetical protein
MKLQSSWARRSPWGDQGLPQSAVPHPALQARHSVWRDSHAFIMPSSLARRVHQGVPGYPSLWQATDPAPHLAPPCGCGRYPSTGAGYPWSPLLWDILRPQDQGPDPLAIASCRRGHLPTPSTKLSTTHGSIISRICLPILCHSFLPPILSIYPDHHTGQDPHKLCPVEITVLSQASMLALPT